MMTLCKDSQEDNIVSFALRSACVTEEEYLTPTLVWRAMGTVPLEQFKGLLQSEEEEKSQRFMSVFFTK